MTFMTGHLGCPIPSPAIIEKIGTAFRRSVTRVVPCWSDACWAVDVSVTSTILSAVDLPASLPTPQ